MQSVKRKMSQMEEDFEDDERTACKYGASCYQKNEAHREKYKHPTSATQSTV